MDNFDTYTAKVGERIVIHRDGQDTTMTIWHISEPGLQGITRADGPRIFAHTKPGGFGMSFDAASLRAGYYTVTKAEPEPEEAPGE